MRPDIIKILELARDLIRDEYLEEDFEKRRYETLMIANAIDIAARQVTSGITSKLEEMQNLRNILGSSTRGEPNQVLLQTLSQQIRNGKYDPNTPLHNKVHKFLKNSTKQSVKRYNPGYFKKENP